MTYGLDSAHLGLDLDPNYLQSYQQTTEDTTIGEK